MQSFSSSLKPQYKHIFISPHPDDICFSCCSALMPKDSIILNIFNLSCWSFDRKPDQKNADIITNMRKQEEINFCLFVGAEVKFFGLEDSSLRYGFTGTEYSLSSKQDGIYRYAQSRILTFLRSQNNIKNIYVPLGISGHIDHLICRDIILKNKELIRKVILYEDLPYAARHKDSYIQTYARQLEINSAFHFTRKIEESVKVEALQFYQSQLEAKTISTIVSYGQRLGNDKMIYERFWTYCSSLTPGKE